MASWYDEVFEDELRLGLKVERTLFSKQSPYQKVEILETTRFGRVLAIDGVFMTSEKDERLYHEMLVHPAMNTAPRARRVLVIGGGDGGTVREVLRHDSVERCVMIELDPVVVDASREFLPTIGSAWGDPRLDLRIGDGVAFVKESGEPEFDVILLDGMDPVGPGEALFEVEFYQSVKRMLAPDGVFALQSESPLLQEEVFVETQEKLHSLFDEVHPYFGPVPIYGAGVWSWTWCSDAGHPRDLPIERVATISAGCEYYNDDIHRSAFALPNYLRRALEG